MELKGFDDLIKACDKDIDRHLDDKVNELGKSLLSKTKKRTPVNKSKYVKGGRLRRSWKIQKLGGGKLEIYNNTEYANHVEYGHRVRGKSYKIVPGVFMLRDSLAQIENEIDDALESVINEIWD